MGHSETCGPQLEECKEFWGLKWCHEVADTDMGLWKIQCHRLTITQHYPLLSQHLVPAVGINYCQFTEEKKLEPHQSNDCL